MELRPISTGRNPPTDLHAVIEIPLGGVPVKYEKGPYESNKTHTARRKSQRYRGAP